jgi:raffinose/stachyose/melibiose transport system substrate-binding protein
MTTTKRNRVRLRVIAGLGVLGLLATACGGSGSSSGNSSAAGGGSQMSILMTTENTQVPAVMKALSTGACAAENTALPLTVDQTPSANMQQKVQLLAGQNALPVMFAPTNSLITKGGSLQTSGQVIDVKQKLTDLGVADDLTPAALSTMEKLFNGEHPTVPFQFNIEGIFYNKKMLSDNGITPPQTWTELVAAATKLKAAGIQPFTASGKTGWTISRWVGAYILRDLGPDALQAVADKTAKLTDPGYVKAAQAVQDLGKAGFFGPGVSSTDYNTENASMLTGKAAMMYMGSWFLANVNDPTQNTLGPDAIGFMPFPGVDGGKGSIDQYPANVGSANAVSAKLYNDKVGAWLKCIAQNAGTQALKDQGSFSGFKVNTPVTSLPPLTQDLQDRIAKSTTTVLWFEALFNSKANTDASANAAPLLTGAMSAADYMKTLQTDLDTAN